MGNPNGVSKKNGVSTLKREGVRRLLNIMKLGYNWLTEQSNVEGKQDNAR